MTGFKELHQVFTAQCLEIQLILLIYFNNKLMDTFLTQSNAYDVHTLGY